MKLEGSCQCAKVKFTVESTTPYPYMYCYCSICRKVAGALGACNIMGERKSLKVTGKANLKFYHAIIRNPGHAAHSSSAQRWFCGRCGTHLYLLDAEWPDGIWPNAAVIDTPLPVPPKIVQIMLQYKPKWVRLLSGGQRFQKYPKLSIADWHRRNVKGI